MAVVRNLQSSNVESVMEVVTLETVLSLKLDFQPLYKRGRLRIQCDDRATIYPGVIKFFTDNSFNYGIFRYIRPLGDFSCQRMR